MDFVSGSNIESLNSAVHSRTDSVDTAWDKLRVPLAHLLYLFLGIFGCSLSIAQLYGGPLLVLWWRGQATRTIRNSSPRKICGTKKLQKSQRVAKYKFWSQLLLKKAKFMFFGSKRANLATLDSYPQPLRPGSTAGTIYFCKIDYDDIISLDYRKKSAVRTV